MLENSILKRFHLFIQVRGRIQRGRRHEIERIYYKKEPWRVDLTLLFCEAHSTSVINSYEYTFMKYVIEVNYTFTL